LTAYQQIIASHLIILFNRGDIVTPIVVIEETQRDFVIDISVQHGYVPVFSDAAGGYFQFSGIKKILPC
jgi:hypothetical protein